MKGKFKFIVVSFLLVFVGTVLIAATDYYFTSKSKVVNNFSTGDIDIAVDEDFKPPIDWEGGTVDKEVRIKNNSKSDALVRVSIVPRWVDENNNPWAGDTTFVKLNYSTDWAENWVKGEDSYFYYNKIIPTGESSKALLDSVTVQLPKELGNRYKGKKLFIDVKAEAVMATKEAHRAAWQNSSDSIKNMLDKLCRS